MGGTGFGPLDAKLPRHLKGLYPFICNDAYIDCGMFAGQVSNNDMLCQILHISDLHIEL